MQVLRHTLVCAVCVRCNAAEVSQLEAVKAAFKFPCRAAKILGLTLPSQAAAGIAAGTRR